MDDLIHAGKRQWMFAFLAGVAFNFGNMLLTSAISVAGMAVVFPTTLGLTVVLSMLFGKLRGATLNGSLLALGSASMVLAILMAALAYANAMAVRRAALLAQDRKRDARRTGAAKGLVLSIIAALPMALMYYFLARATPPEVGLGAYSLMGLFAFGVLVSTVLFNIFFMNLPIEGEPLEIRDYLKQRPVLHLWGLLAGVVWCAGTLANWVSLGAPVEAQVSRPLSLGLSQGGIFLGMLWGLVVWKDLRETRAAGRVMIALLIGFLGAGLTLLSLAVTVPGAAGR
jgi:glucose uptake protein